jgi:sugar lactone lactonase YvrE
VKLNGNDANGLHLTAQDTIQSRPHEEVQLSLTLGGPQPDMAVPDGALPDLANANPDLEPRTLGTLSVVAGQIGGQGVADGTGTDARLQAPQTILISGTTLYMLDARGFFRKVDLTTMSITTIPLTTMTGNSFTFSGDQGLAFDGANTFYVAATYESAIRKIVVSGATGTVSLVAGMTFTDASNDGVGTMAGFMDPEGVALDGAGHLWVADSGNATIRMIDLATQTVSTPAGTPGMTGWVDATGAAARFKRPNQLVFYNNDLYVTDGQGGGSGNTGIRKLVVTPTPSPAPVTSVVGNGTPAVGFPDGPVLSGTAGLGNGDGITLSGSTFYVVDTNRNNVRTFTLGGMLTTIAGDPMGAGGTMDGNGQAARFLDPRSIALDSNFAYVCDDYENVLRKIGLTAPNAVTTPLGLAGHWGSADAQGANARFNEPSAVLADSPDSVYVAEYANNTIRHVIISTGVVTTIAGSNNVTAGTDGQGTNCAFANPSGLALDNQGNLFVSDSSTSVIRKVTFSSGVATVTTVAGTKNMTGTVDAVGTAARFERPLGLAFDGDHTLFIADYDQDTIRAMDVGTLAVTTLAGQATIYGGKNGPGLMAHFANPEGLLYDRAQQKLYVGEDNCDIRVITFNPVTVARLAGQFGTCGHADGDFTTATFGQVGALALEGNYLYVSDPDNALVRRLDLNAMMVTSPIGIPHIEATRPGPLPAAINSPAGLAIVSSGLVIASFNENSILLAH